MLDSEEYLNSIGATQAEPIPQTVKCKYCGSKVSTSDDELHLIYGSLGGVYFRGCSQIDILKNIVDMLRDLSGSEVIK